MFLVMTSMLLQLNHQLPHFEMHLLTFPTEHVVRQENSQRNQNENCSSDSSGCPVNYILKYFWSGKMLVLSNQHTCKHTG